MREPSQSEINVQTEQTEQPLLINTTLTDRTSQTYRNNFQDRRTQQLFTKQNTEWDINCNHTCNNLQCVTKCFMQQLWQHFIENQRQCHICNLRKLDYHIHQTYTITNIYQGREARSSESQEQLVLRFMKCQSASINILH